MEASHPAHSPSVAVIVPVRNGAATITRCIEAVLAQDYSGQLDIFVVDNNSTDGTADIVARHRGVHLLSEPRPGSYAARNKAMASTPADILMFTDADCEPRPTWVSAAVAGLGSNGFAVGPVDLFATEAPATSWTLWELVHSFPQETYFREHGFGVTANLTVRRAAFEAAGPFDASLMSGGDKEWCRRATACGVAGTYCSEAAVRHPTRASLPEVKDKVRRVAGGTVDVRVQSGQPALQPRDLMPPVRSVRAGLQHDKLVGAGDRVRYLYAVVGHYLMRVYFAVALARSARHSPGHTQRSIAKGSA